MKIYRKSIIALTMAVKGFIAFGLLSVHSAVVANESNLTLKDCHVEGIKQQIQCGKLLVPENYAKPDGEKITINFAVLPAIDKSQNKEPLMFLAGGPGQAAVSLAGGLYKAFNEVRKSRALILVDQRGTGESHPLQCDDNIEQDVYSSIPEDFTAQDVKDCLATFTGDLSQYNSENAIRDFDAVRAALNHDKIAIYGGSYGTRAGLVYMRLFPESLSSVVLDSVGPIEVPIGLFGKSAERSFSMLLENCQKEASCQQAYPNLANEFKQVIATLDETPVSINIPHPRLGTQTPLVVNKSKFISAIFMQLYSIEGRSLVPLIIHQASLGNFSPFVGLTAMSEGGMGMYVGLTFNIVCNEDMPKVTQEMIKADSDNNFNGNLSHVAWQTACPLWPQYRPSEDFYNPVTADIPTLIISGELDPVTPPSNGEYSNKTLPNSKHIIMKHSSHTPAVSGCAINVINEFLNKKDPNDLDESCLDEIPAESFMTGLNGGI
ncbi:alpha/beta hydrolase [Colwellia sp. 1_MG-2023]|uniref:alpha/beta hydrolase n=1 Tax=Colwellia sp. 1_MG-2023 TaxID=3062649 RepID=UPI0026E2C3F3|nr:alpha/beta hydrolase [Colwellia sp. 1_MG-2023]MDO6444571.1 alpha/beta hydrolase [Colwellia sp. 1_MG-2023]